MILLSGSNGLLGTVLKKHFDQKKITYTTIGRSNCDFNGNIQITPLSKKQLK